MKKLFICTMLLTSLISVVLPGLAGTESLPTVTMISLFHGENH